MCIGALFDDPVFDDHDRVDPDTDDDFEEEVGNFAFAFAFAEKYKLIKLRNTLN